MGTQWPEKPRPRSGHLLHRSFQMHQCVGFHDHEACAAVCPVDCCVPDPANPETQGVLLARARTLHPELSIPDDAPSRFLKEGGAAPAAAPPAEANGAAAAPAPAPAPAS